MNIPQCVAIHVVRDEARVDTLLSGSPALHIELDVSGAQTVPELEQALITAFAITDPCSGIDAIIDMAADVDLYRPSASGYLLVVRGLDSCPPCVGAMLASIVPAIVDRLSAGMVCFECLLITDSSRATIESQLRAANDELRAFGAASSVGNTDAVPIYVDGQLIDGPTREG